MRKILIAKCIELKQNKELEIEEENYNKDYTDKKISASRIEEENKESDSDESENSENVTSSTNNPDEEAEDKDRIDQQGEDPESLNEMLRRSFAKFETLDLLIDSIQNKKLQ
jgi:hypothetical protein